MTNALLVILGAWLLAVGLLLLLGVLLLLLRERRLGHRPPPRRVAAIFSVLALVPVAGVVLVGLGGAW